MIKNNMFYISFVNLSLLIFSLGCASQNLVQESFEKYEVINTHFKNNDEITLNKVTTNNYVNESIVKTLDAWNEANDGLENINRKDIDFHKLFIPEEFKKHIDSFLSVKKIKLNRKLISTNIRLKNKSNSTISFPYIFTSSKNKHYALLYGETISSSENGSGEVFLYKKKGGTWNLIFVFQLWIS